MAGNQFHEIFVQIVHYKRISLTNIGSIWNGFSKSSGWIISQALAFGLGLKWFTPWIWKIHFRSRLCSSMLCSRAMKFVKSINLFCFPSGKLTRILFLITKEHTVWKLWKFTLTIFWQIFRESNICIKEVTMELISRNIFLVRLNFSLFHTVCI